jgi:hypothetical protein
MGVLLPVLGKVRRQARCVLGTVNQQHIICAVNCYALDNNESYPESVATIGHGRNWNWQAPTVLTSIESRAPHLHRAMSEYLRGYIDDAGIMFCPSAPQEYKYLHQAWRAGNTWNNPDTWLRSDWVKGVYCFYWNYTGLLENRRLFHGPQNPTGGAVQSNLLVSCYFGYNLYRSPGAYGSCQRFKSADLVSQETASSAYWSRLKSDRFNLDVVEIKPRAGYVDGHVERFSAADAVTMKVIKNRFTNEPYNYGPGDFYLPQNALHSSHRMSNPHSK